MSVPDNESAVDFLLLMEDYHDSFTNAYRADPTLHFLPYDACAKRLFSRPVYYGDAYVDALTCHGFAAKQVVPLCRPLQFKWARMRNTWNPSEWATRMPGNSYPMQVARQLTDRWVLGRILAKQVAKYHPEFVWLFSGIPVSTRELGIWRSHAEHVILWWSCPLIDEFPYSEFDMILTGIPSLASRFEKQGIRAVHLSHAFDPRVLARIPCFENRIPRVAFVGSLSPSHMDRISFLDALSRRVPLDFYGHGEEFLPKDSPMRQSYRGPAWAEDLYSLYGSYLIVVNKNIDIAEKSASAKRLFEATGMGACVLTESSDDLKKLFVSGEEVVTYSDLEECATKVEDLLRDPWQARNVGRHGQARTLKEHTYQQRTGDLLSHLKNHQLL